MSPFGRDKGPVGTSGSVAKRIISPDGISGMALTLREMAGEDCKAQICR